MSQQQNNEIREVLNKYLEEEKELERKIRECENKQHEFRNSKSRIVTPILKSRYDREISHARNQQLLKDLERSKAILRTESTFTPNEQELRDLAADYRKFLQK